MTKMGIDEDLKKLIGHGDWKIIADHINQRRARRITPSYVSKVVNGERAANKGTAAYDILSLTKKYLLNKKKFTEKIHITS